VLSFPGILVAITLAALIGPGLTTVGLGILIFLVPGYIRIVYAEVLYLREREFVLAARALGAGSFRILLRHVLPNAAAPIIVQLTLNMAAAVLSAASLSYLGLGAQPPTPEWGAMISEGQQHLRNAPHVVTFPGLAILALVLGFSLLGDALHDALDPILSHAA
jgi:peptide/nickel transport system permease protein